MMKRISVAFLLMFIACTVQGQNGLDQKLILKKVLSDKTFENIPDTVFVLKNEHLQLPRDVKMAFNDTEIVVVDSRKNHPKVIEFITYEKTNNFIVVELLLFRKNLIYAATYRKNDSGISEIMKNVRFIRKPVN